MTVLLLIIMQYFTLKFRSYARWDNFIKLYISEIMGSIVNLYYFTNEIFKLTAKIEKKTSQV